MEQSTDPSLQCKFKKENLEKEIPTNGTLEICIQ
uniref:Uncharacterized protein n=1 Tax=Arundo donax TaxID=35708 RepID=A0A0A9U836_ARUDO